jgi:polysaccharide deacetylase family protein (PEP-CTERM system associated)
MPIDVRSAHTLADLDLTPLRLEPALRLLTVDVEDWFHANFASAPSAGTAAPDPQVSHPSRVESGVAATLELLAERNVKATFFVLGCVAQEHPGVVRRIADAGHEIACHAMQHELVYEMEPRSFVEVAAAARRLLEDESGRPVRGFRAPSWSITERNLWAFDALVEAGFEYDSSVFPGSSPLYGIANAPTGPYRVRTREGGSLVEVPPSVMRLGPLRTGIGGGVYLRALPLGVQRLAMSRYARRGEPFMVYVHPRELDPSAWDLKLPLSPLDQLFHRIGLRSTPRKLRALLAHGSWRTIGDALQSSVQADSNPP